MPAIEPSQLRPKGLAHIGIQTHDTAKIRDWYCTVLNARVVYEKPGIFCTITFDEEHHRIAIIGLPGKPIRKFRANAEYAHVAFEMPSLEVLLLNWERLRDLGITPVINSHHGATLSCYYLDPDGNQCELFVDCFPTKKETQDWFFAPAYQHNFGAGTDFDPAELLAKKRAGVPDEALVKYPYEEGMKVDAEKIMRAYLHSVEAETAAFVKDVQQ